MSADNSLFIRGGRVVSVDGVERADVHIHRGRVKAVGPDLPVPKGVTTIGAGGMLVFPGIVDSQVHFREPGLEHKEDLASGSLSAIAGGVTTFCEMPNTKPPTTDPEALREKFRLAEGRCHADHAFFVGASAANAEQLEAYEQTPGCAGVKIFMGSSTGSLLVPDDDTLERILRSGTRRVAIHSEDEPRLQERYAAIQPGTHVREHPHVRDVESAVRSTRRLFRIVEKTGRKVHLLHVSTAEEIQLLREHDLGELITAEATPNHLFLAAPGCYDEHGSLAQMNPPVREQRHQDAIREAVADGTIACIGSDHAPHTREEKARPYPESPSGIPGVQTILPLLLTAVRDGWLSLPDIARLACLGGAEVYGIERKGHLGVGADGDVTIVDPDITEPLPVEWLRSQTGFSPFVGRPLAGWPVTTILRGEIAYRDHAPVGSPKGRPLSFASLGGGKA